MKKQKPEEMATPSNPRFWAHADAIRAVPYLRSVVASVREHWLTMQQARRELQLIDARPGRPSRETLLQRGMVQRDAQEAEKRVDEALSELLALDIYCLNPGLGQASIPFEQSGHLAWFIFDLFEPEGLKSWRFDGDPLTKRRVLGEPLDHNLIDALFSRGPRDLDGMGQGGTNAPHYGN